jgi:hypothetical protein
MTMRLLLFAKAGPEDFLRSTFDFGCFAMGSGEKDPNDKSTVTFLSEQ